METKTSPPGPRIKFLWCNNAYSGYVALKPAQNTPNHMMDPLITVSLSVRLQILFKLSTKIESIKAKSLQQM